MQVYRCFSQASGKDGENVIVVQIIKKKYFQDIKTNEILFYDFILNIPQQQKKCVVYAQILYYHTHIA